MLRKPQRWGLSTAQLDEDDSVGVTKREKVAHVIVEKFLAAHPVVLREILKRVWPEVSRNRIDSSACGECCKPARWEKRRINGAARPLRSRRGLVRRV